MEPVKATIVADILESTTPGAIQYTTGKIGLYYVCPCGCSTIGYIPFSRWHWDGNKKAPTITPSIRIVRHCCYHGYLRNGMWTFEADSGIPTGQ